MPTYYFGEGLSGPTYKSNTSTFGAGGHSYSQLDEGLQTVPLVYQCIENTFTNSISTAESIIFGDVNDVANFSGIDTAELGAGDFQFKYQLVAGADGAVVSIDSVQFQFTYEFDVGANQSPAGVDPILGYSSLNGVAIGGGYVVAAGAQSAIYYSTDYGQTWNPATSPVESDFRDVIWDGTKFYICGTGGVILESADGQNWAVNRLDRTTDFIDLAKVRGGDLVILGFDETMLLKDSLESSFIFVNRTQL